MFTGIVEELGEVIEVTHYPAAARLRIRGPLVTSDAAAGASIAVNGCCLTVVDLADGAFTADVMAETLDKTMFGDLRAGSPVNLERPVRVQDRLGGHIVQGHVDGVGTVLSREHNDRWDIVAFAIPEALARYVV